MPAVTQQELLDAFVKLDPKPNSVIFVDATVVDVNSLAEIEFPEQYEDCLLIPVKVRPGQKLQDAILQMDREQVQKIFLDADAEQLKQITREALDPSTPSPGHAPGCPCHRCRISAEKREKSYAAGVHQHIEDIKACGGTPSHPWPPREVKQ